jgi:hypothetical protein
VKKLQISCLLSVLLLSTSVILADTPPAPTPAGTSEIQKQEPKAELFSADELELSLFSTYTVSEPNIRHVFDLSDQSGDYGAGVSVAYFPKRNFGVELDATIPNVNRIGDGPLIDTASVSLVARVPLGHLAPFAKGGVGRNFDDKTLRFTSHVELGCEWRFNRSAGVFLSDRYVFQTSDRRDQQQVRLGFSCVF